MGKEEVSIETTTTKINTEAITPEMSVQKVMAEISENSGLSGMSTGRQCITIPGELVITGTGMITGLLTDANGQTGDAIIISTAEPGDVLFWCRITATGRNHWK